MTRLFSLMAVVVVAAIAVSTPVILAQQQPPTARTEKVFEGELSKVDASAKTLSVKGTGGAEMIFIYTDQTQVGGPDKSIQGLADKAGTTLKITYRDQNGRNVATRIEMIEKKQP